MKQTWRRRHDTANWWKSVGLLAALALIELYASCVPIGHK